MTNDPIDTQRKEVTQVDRSTKEEAQSIDRKEAKPGSERSIQRNRNLIILSLVIIVAVILLIIFLFVGRGRDVKNTGSVAMEAGHTNEKEDGHGDEHQAGGEIELSPEALASAGIEIEGVTQRPAVALLLVTGTVEANQEKTHQVTPLVSGRIEHVFVSLGDNVRSGSVLATISSPQIAQMHGKLHEAETQLALAFRNLDRVQKAENRAAVLSAKAKLDEAEATLRRTKRLVDLGVGAGKDLIAAETGYKTAKAEYDFQSNIALSRELQEARAAVETAKVDVTHIRDEMRALGAMVPESIHDHRQNSSRIRLHAPVSGIVIERLVNPGAGVKAGKPLFTIANLSTVWVIANVPEGQINQLRVGAPAEVRSTALGSRALSGHISYIDPQLNEETRTARVRVELLNPGGKLKAGMFVDVGFQAGTNTASGEELVVPSEAVQRIGDRTVVFIPKENEVGHFEVRDVQLGGEVEGYRKVLDGLSLGEKVVAKGSFTLKTQMMKNDLGDHDH
jgi:membrane fusion protein, heavy metal efflux system